MSVILPTFNRRTSISRAIRSVLAQTYSFLELVVVDDGSTDDTANIVTQILDDRIKYIRRPINGGAAAARNTGIKHATGELLAFQDSDDEWLIEHLQAQVQTLLALGSTYGAVFSGKLVYGKTSNGLYGDRCVEYIPSRNLVFTSDSLTKHLLRGNFITPQALIVRRAMLELAGLFDEVLQCNEDWEFVIRLSLVTKINWIEGPAVISYVSPDSISRNLRRDVYSRLYILRKFRHLFVRDTPAWASQLYIIGRTLQNLNRLKRARKVLAAAFVKDPWLIKSLVALVLPMRSVCVLKMWLRSRKERDSRFSR